MGGILNQKHKTKIIRAFRAPSAPMVMSLMALILIVGAPALVSMIDNSINEDYAVEVALDDTNAFGSYDMGSTFPVASDVVTILPSDGGWMISPLDQSKVPTITAYRMYYDGSAFSSADPTIVTVSLSGTPTSVVFRFTTDTGAQVFPMVLGDDGSYSITLTSADKILLTSGSVNKVMIFATYQAGTAPAVFSGAVTAYSMVTVPYAEIIVGATGALLIVCALLATPWLGTSGLTIRRR